MVWGRFKGESLVVLVLGRQKEGQGGAPEVQFGIGGMLRKGSGQVEEKVWGDFWR